MPAKRATYFLLALVYTDETIPSAVRVKRPSRREWGGCLSAARDAVRRARRASVAQSGAGGRILDSSWFLSAVEKIRTLLTSTYVFYF